MFNRRSILSCAETLQVLCAFLLCFAASVHAQKSDSAQRPAWLSELSLSAKETYDDNVFMSGVDKKFLPASPTIPAGSAAALENRSSFVTTISPKIGVNLAPLLGNGTVLQLFSLAYAPDFVIFHDQTSESYDAHRFFTTIKATAGNFSASADNTFTYIDGSKFGPTYPGALYNALMNATVRERREQIQDRATVSLRYDAGRWFIRPVASLLYYDFMTEQLNVSGYQSYADRYDANGGFDLGRKIFHEAYLTLGYRYGHQYQQQFSYAPYSSPSDYHRVLVGVEGKPWRWLELKAQGGPEFRSYEKDSATHITPVHDHHPVKYYVEASATALVTDNDTLTFKMKDWQWVSSIGKVPYLDSLYDLNYHRKVSQQLGFDLGGRIWINDFTEADLPTCYREDVQYTLNAAVTYTFNSHASTTLSYLHDFGRNLQDRVVKAQTRSFDHNLISLGAVMKF